MRTIKAADRYRKLAPERQTPADEVCCCPGEPPVVLQDHLSSVPLACLKCNGEVPPERLGFSAGLAEELAQWRDLHRAFMTLWLDSGEYESWAREQLEDANAPVHLRGSRVVEALNRYRRTYYWWFANQADDKPGPRTSCPRCGEGVVECSINTGACDTPPPRSGGAQQTACSGRRRAPPLMLSVLRSLLGGRWLDRHETDGEVAHTPPPESQRFLKVVGAQRAIIASGLHAAVLESGVQSRMGR
jgi:hypothetical protein